MDDIFQLAVEASPAAMILVGPDGRIQHVNAECERMFRRPRAELVGALIEMLVPGSVRAQHTQLRDSFIARPSKRLMGVGRDLRAVLITGDTSSTVRDLRPDDRVHLVSKPIDADQLLSLLKTLLST